MDGGTGVIAQEPSQALDAEASVASWLRVQFVEWDQSFLHPRNLVKPTLLVHAHITYVLEVSLGKTKRNLVT